MLRNKFRMVIGISVLVVFGLAVVQFFRQTSGNKYLGSALRFGLGFLLIVGLVLLLIRRLDRRINKRES